MSEKQVELIIPELKDFLDHIIKTNQKLQAEGKNSVSVEVVGESGIGKTSAMLQIANEKSLNYVKLNLAQIEELGDLVGFPIKQFQMALNKGTEKEPNWNTQWIDEPLLDDARDKGYKATGKTQMSYCQPEWVPTENKGGILLLDDWNRADLRFVQAVMELIDRGEYISWKMPPNWTIILTANPDNGDYLVQSIDSAQRTRFITVNLRFDVDAWAVWAEKNGIDSRCINFLLLHHKEVVNQETNARSITTFFNAISSIKTFEDQLPLIQNIGEGSVGVEFASLFTTFINQKLDKLIDPKEMLTGDNEADVIAKLRSSIGMGDKYRGDIAGVLCTRFANFSVVYSEDNPIQEKHIKRVQKLITESVFGTDLQYYAAREMVKGNKKKFEKLLADPKVVAMITDT